MAQLRFLRTRRLPPRSYAKAFGLSVGVHVGLAAIVIIGVAGHSLLPPRASRPQPGIVGSEPRNGTGGVMSVAAPPVGPSLNPELGRQYIGRYLWRSPRGVRVLDVGLINDGETEHWSLAVVENQGPVRTLVIVAQDSFAFQLAPEQRVLFRRVGDSVTSISIRRGRDTSWAERAIEGASTDRPQRH
jgi:hypothetical protein